MDKRKQDIERLRREINEAFIGARHAYDEFNYVDWSINYEENVDRMIEILSEMDKYNKIIIQKKEELKSIAFDTISVGTICYDEHFCINSDLMYGKFTSIKHFLDRNK